MTDPKHRYSLPQDILSSLEAGDDVAGLEEVWDMASDTRGALDAAWIQRAGTQIRGNLHQITGRRAKIRRMPVVYAIAASIAVLIAVGITLQPRNTTITVPHGSEVRHVLPDGSILQANSGSHVEYRRTFGKELRHVRLLKGEGHFSVTRSDTPFHVETHLGTVEVLGTSFNVRSWPDDNFAEIAVTSGRVKVTAHHSPEQSTILHAGEAMRIATDVEPQHLEPGHVEHAISWRSGSFKFSNHPLDVIIREVERRYDVAVETSPNMDLDERVGILIENPVGPMEILRDLCELKGCESRAVPDGFAVTYEGVK